jgi:predicted RNase H-like HicB family nuclease
MLYPVVINKDQDSEYGASVPDLPGCFSAGETFDEVLENAKEAIQCHIEGLMLDGETIPLAGKIELHKNDPQWSEGVWALVQIDLSRLSGKSKRVNITLPERLLSQVDSHAAQQGETRSGFLAQAALEYMSRHGPDSV